MLSCSAVASAMVAARGGSPRCTATAEMRAALADCSGVKVNDVPEAVARHSGEKNARCAAWYAVQPPTPERDDDREQDAPRPTARGCGGAQVLACRPR